MKTTIWATIIENVVRKGRNEPILDSKCARFPGENANLTNGTHFTHIQPPPPAEILYVWAFSCVLKGKKAPNIKNLQGLGAPWRGGLGGGFLAKFFMFMPFFGA